MKRNQRPTVRCPICGEQKRLTDVLPGELVRKGVVETIRKAHPDWSPDDYICLADLDHFRTQYVQEVLEAERGELSTLEIQVVQSMREQELLTRNIYAEFDRGLTLGERVADRVAEFGGSWRFIILFGVILFSWVLVNSHFLLRRPFDPFPFILLNLILSCLAALQAPVIMMSQNRQEERDRLRAEHDFRINLKAELEIRNLHAKIDELLMHQWQRLLEIQQIQVEMMEELIRHGQGVAKG